MKILFLDIDGVVNNSKTPTEDGWPIDPYCAFLVGRIVIATDCKVVLSSSWRWNADGQEIVRKKVIPFMDTTPTGEEGKGMWSRGTEIKTWLDKHPEVTRYAILDDNNDMHQDQLPNFFQTTFASGLTEEIANKVIEHLSS